MQPQPPHQPPPGSKVSVEIGERTVSGSLISASYEPGKRSLVVSIVASELADAGPDYTNPARVWVLANGERVFGLAGSVTRAERKSEDMWHVSIAELGAIQDTKVGGLGTRNCEAPEIFWALIRDVGFPEDRVAMHGWTPPAEKFFVAVPVEGVVPVADLDAGNIGVTRDPDVPRRFLGLGPSDLQGSFVAPGLWAITVVSGTRMWDAEQEAVRRFERLLGRLAVAARYSFAVGPHGDLRPFDIRIREEPRLRRIAGVQGSQTGRTWLRGYATSGSAVAVDPHVIDGLASVIGAPSERIDEAIAAWRRASRDEDSATAAVALSEALEFYAADVQVEPLFNKGEIRAMTKAAQAVIAGRADKALGERVTWRLGQLNEPPATMRLRAAIEADDAPCSEREFDLLRRVRDVRRRVLHGGARDSLTPDEVREALALVNRFLVFRLKRLSTTTPTTGDPTRTKS
jgi:hypothetical protein